MAVRRTQPAASTSTLSVPEHQPIAGETLMPLRGAAARIAENMKASLTIPLATSQRVMPVKVIDENRRILNKHRALIGKSKISYTHIIAWAIVKALRTNPSLNHAFAETNGEPFRVVRDSVNIGIAVDVAGKDGSRSLKVPNIKNAGSLNFAQFLAAYRRHRCARAQQQADGAGFRRHHHFADQSRHGGHARLGAAADAGPGRDHRHRRHRLSGRISRRHRTTARLARLEQSDDGDLHLRSSRDAGR